MEAHVKAVNEALLKGNGTVDEGDEEQSGSEWEGIEEEAVLLPQKVEWEEDYVDEEKYTTVTVEEVGISKSGFVRVDDEDEDEREHQDGGNTVNAPDANPPNTKQADKDKKKKKRSFRYLNKAERTVTRVKERSKNSAQAKARKRKK